MSYFDVLTGRQTWSDYISSRDQIKGFEKALAKAGSVQAEVSLSNY